MIHPDVKRKRKAERRARRADPRTDVRILERANLLMRAFCAIPFDIPAGDVILYLTEENPPVTFPRSRFDEVFGPLDSSSRLREKIDHVVEYGLVPTIVLVANVVRVTGVTRPAKVNARGGVA